MSLKQKIMYALTPFGFPIEELKYTGTEKEWITYNITLEEADDFESDEPHIESQEVDIHLFINKDKSDTKLKKDIKKALVSKGFTYPTTQVLFENDTNLKHIIFSCKTAERI